MRAVHRLLTDDNVDLWLLTTAAGDAAAGRYTEYSALLLEYYTYQAAGELKFVLQPADTWFPQFLAEAELLWSAARELPLPTPESA